MSLRKRPGIPQDSSKEAVVSIRFGPFTLDRDTRQLIRGHREIHLSPKAFDLLLVLAEARPVVLSKAALQQHLWPATFVAEANLSNLVSEVRHALGDDVRRPVFVRTVHRIGYRFCAETGGGCAPRPPATSACWLEWGRRRFPLMPGEHIIGRDMAAAIRLDGVTVSRQHAKLVVTDTMTMLEDCASKNGTFHGEARIGAPVRLKDGDTIGIGALMVTFREATTSGSTLTDADR